MNIFDPIILEQSTILAGEYMGGILQKIAQYNSYLVAITCGRFMELLERLFPCGSYSVDAPQNLHTTLLCGTVVYGIL